MPRIVATGRIYQTVIREAAALNRTRSFRHHLDIGAGRGERRGDQTMKPVFNS